MINKEEAQESRDTPVAKGGRRTEGQIAAALSG
jgi:hypothetical protein